MIRRGLTAFWWVRTVDLSICFDMCRRLFPSLAFLSRRRLRVKGFKRKKKKEIIARSKRQGEKKKESTPEPCICHRAEKNWAWYNLAECMKRRAEWSRRTSKVVRISPPFAVPYPTWSRSTAWTITPTCYFLRGLPLLGTPAGDQHSTARITQLRLPRLSRRLTPPSHHHSRRPHHLGPSVTPSWRTRVSSLSLSSFYLEEPRRLDAACT